MKITIEATINIEEESLPAIEDFGKWLRRERTRRGLNMKDLSQMSGVSNSHIGRIEKGARIPNYAIVLKLQRALKEVENQER